MYKIYSKIEPNKLLHMVYRFDDITQQPGMSRDDIIPEEHFLQLSSIKLKKDQTFRPHRHIWKTPSTQSLIAQESWVVLHGKVKCTFYDLDDTIIDTPILTRGDCSITLEGGHTYSSLEEDTIVYEYKTGPYLGQKLDKNFLDEI